MVNFFVLWYACCYFQSYLLSLMFFVVVCFQSEAQKQLEEIKALRERMKGVADEARGKEDIYKQLVMRSSTSECFFLIRISCPWCKKVTSTGTSLLHRLISYTVYVLYSALFQL